MALEYTLLLLVKKYPSIPCEYCGTPAFEKGTPQRVCCTTVELGYYEYSYTGVRIKRDLRYRYT